MDIDQRIAQFENMVQADPDNDMAHFSLGNAYEQAGQFQEAADSFMRCISLNDAMSKAYQLAGAAYIAAGQNEMATSILTKGYEAAAKRGDMMPVRAMGELLEKLGQPLPDIGQAVAESVPEGSFVCSRTGKPGTQMESPPFRGPIGEWIADNIAQETFTAWIAQGTKVINELRLDMSRDQDAAMYDQHMHEFLGIDDQLLSELAAKV